jgi:hypothetical protein
MAFIIVPLALSELSTLPPEIIYWKPPITKNRTARPKAKPTSQLITLKISPLTPLVPKEQFKPEGQGIMLSWAKAVYIGHKKIKITKIILASLWFIYHLLRLKGRFGRDKVKSALKQAQNIKSGIILL